MGLYEFVRNREEKLSVIGLGYVGMPLSILFAKIADVVGFDISKVAMFGITFKENCPDVRNTKVVYIIKN